MRYTLLLLVSSLLCFCLPAAAQDNCETYTAASLQNLVPLLHKNDFAKIQSLITTIQSTCGETELGLRLQIIEKLLKKENSSLLIKNYLDKKYDEKLVQRFDYAAENNFARIYQKNPAQFDFIPLRHEVDSLIRVKSIALLNSTSFTLNQEEEAISLLFADQIDQFYTLLKRRPSSRPIVDKLNEIEEGKRKTSGVLYSGVFMPIGNNDYLKTSPTFGFTIMSPLSAKFVFELGVKFRVNGNNDSFDFRDDGVPKEINSKSSYFLGMNMGYNLSDRGSWVVMPKIGMGLGFINTKLSTTTFYDNVSDFGEDYTTSGIRYNNVNTLHSSAGLSVMRHIKRKLYIGLEASYHYVPYNWDKNLISVMKRNFSSVELFLRF